MRWSVGSPSSGRRTRTNRRPSPDSWRGCRSGRSSRRRPRAVSSPRSRLPGRSRPGARVRATVARARHPRAAGRTPVARVAGPSREARPSRKARPTRILRSVVEVTVARETEKRAASVEEAVEAALDELGVSEQEARIDVLQEPRSGVLGIGSHEAVVRVRIVALEVDPEDLEEQADTAADFLEELMGHMGIDAVAEPNLHRDHMYVDIVGEDEDDMALLIGRHGQTLDAIQELTR